MRHCFHELRRLTSDDLDIVVLLLARRRQVRTLTLGSLLFEQTILLFIVAGELVSGFLDHADAYLSL